MIVMGITQKISKGGEAHEDGAGTYSASDKPEDQARCLAVSGIHGQRVYSGLVGTGTKSLTTEERSIDYGAINKRAL